MFLTTKNHFDQRLSNFFKCQKRPGGGRSLLEGWEPVAGLLKVIWIRFSKRSRQVFWILFPHHNMIIDHHKIWNRLRKRSCQILRTLCPHHNMIITIADHQVIDYGSGEVISSIEPERQTSYLSCVQVLQLLQPHCGESAEHLPCPLMTLFNSHLYLRVTVLCKFGA